MMRRENYLEINATDKNGNNFVIFCVDSWSHDHLIINFHWYPMINHPSTLFWNSCTSISNFVHYDNNAILFLLVSTIYKDEPLFPIWKPEGHTPTRVRETDGTKTISWVSCHECFSHHVVNSSITSHNASNPWDLTRSGQVTDFEDSGWFILFICQWLARHPSCL